MHKSWVDETLIYFPYGWLLWYLRIYSFTRTMQEWYHCNTRELLPFYCAKKSSNKKSHVVSTVSSSSTMVVKTDYYYVLVLPLLLCLVRVLPWFWSYYSLWESIICTWTKKDLLGNCNGSERAIMICHVKNAHAYSRYKQSCAKSFIHKVSRFC